MDKLPQYIQILPHRTYQSNRQLKQSEKWSRLIFLANSGWLGTTPSRIFNSQNESYINNLLALPLGISEEDYSNHKSNNSAYNNDSQLGWSNGHHLHDDNPGIMGYYYGGDEPSDDDTDLDYVNEDDGNSHDSEYLSNVNFPDEYVSDEDFIDTHDLSDDMSDDIVIGPSNNRFENSVQISNLFQRNISHAPDTSIHNGLNIDNNYPKDSYKFYDKHLQTGELNELLPTKLVPHRDIYISNDSDEIPSITLTENGCHIDVHKIWLKPECALISSEAIDIRDKVQISSLYSLRSSCISSSIPVLTSTQNIKLFESNAINKKLNQERRISDQENIFTTFLSSTSVSNDIGIYYFEAQLLNTRTNINDGFSIGITNVIANSQDENWCDESIKSEKSNVVWVAKTGQLSYYHDPKCIEKDLKTSRYQATSVEHWPKYMQGDIVGFGIDFSKKTVFGTKNGIWIGESKPVALLGDDKNVALSISCGVYTEAKVNLGQNEFCYNILNHVRDRKKSINRRIQKEKFTPFKLPNGEQIYNDIGLNKFVDELVLEYLKHRGYVDTAKSLEFDLSSIYNVHQRKVESDWEDISSFKKKIKGMLRNDEIDEIMNQITLKFPEFWKRYERIEFNLLCLKYVKMIDNSNGEVDMKKVLRFGKLLRRKFSGNSTYINELNNVSQFLAYKNPRECPQWWKLFVLEKERVSEALIMAISEIVGLSCLTGIDLGLLRTDVNLESMKVSHKDVSLIDILNDYICL